MNLWKNIESALNLVERHASALELVDEVDNLIVSLQIFLYRDEEFFVYLPLVPSELLEVPMPENIGQLVSKTLNLRSGVNNMLFDSVNIINLFHIKCACDVCNI